MRSCRINMEALCFSFLTQKLEKACLVRGGRERDFESRDGSRPLRLLGNAACGEHQEKAKAQTKHGRRIEQATAEVNVRNPPIPDSPPD